jgi:pyruvate formate lyase activating enzyme
MTVDEVMGQVLQDKDFYQNTNGGMTISGGELLTQPKFAGALLDACERNGIGVALDTCGYGPVETLLSLAGRRSCTHILFDLKLIDSEAHRKYTGVGNEIILRNLAALARDPAINPKIIMRMPLISGVNDSPEDIQRICRLFQDNGLKSVTLMPYHELGVSKCRNIGGEPETFKAPNAGQIAEISECFRTCGVSVEVLGE